MAGSGSLGVRPDVMYVPVHSLRGGTRTPGHQPGSMKRARCLCEASLGGLHKTEDAGISALLQLEVKAGLLSHRLIEVCVCMCVCVSAKTT